MDFDFVDRGGGAEAEVDAGVGGAGEGATGEDVGALADAVGGEVHGGSDGVAWAFGAADEPQGDPVVFGLGDVAEEAWGGVEIVDDGIEVAVVEEVSDGEAAGEG